MSNEKSVWNFGFWDLIGIWRLEFGAYLKGYWLFRNPKKVTGYRSRPAAWPLRRSHYEVYV